MKFDIDYISHNNKLSFVNTDFKMIFAVVAMIITLFFDNLYFDFFIFLLMAILIMAVAGISIKNYLKFITIPFLFTFITCLFLMFFFGNGEIVYNTGIFGIAVREDSLNLAIHTFFRVFGCFSCLGFLALTTPIANILYSLRKAKVPKTLIEIALLMYNTIFIFLNQVDTMKKAQETRLGYVDYKTSVNSLSSLGVNMFLKSLEKSETLQCSLDSRGYDGELPVYEPAK
ncbi:cobalt ECF transporter T component CbiQ [Methanobrevibacter woesei]|uniref:cobalt ECF transporter T component CbiQ n=1 Tax=Methanobrevibacter woesei TaxID=190976 RepID=UPI003208D1DF